jgi:uncharacterized protein (DUF1800 family)
MVALSTQPALTAHLLRRAGFAATPKELAYYQSLGWDRALDELLHPERVDNSELERAIEAQNFDFTNVDDLRRWWLFRMSFSKRPLQEKMTLFWHGHFATGARKVNRPYAMYLQNTLFRKLALGNFADLLQAVSKDPAMILWLDNQQNRREKPNENYAREVMELFTMGIGNYREQDIKEAARAFTGWQVRPDGFFFNQRQHDFGVKTVLGQTGNLNGNDVISILVPQKATAQRLATKLCKFFVSDDPSPQLVDQIARTYLSSRYEIRPVLEALFTHPEFTSEKNFHAKIKSPAELVVGTVKTLQFQQIDPRLPNMMARMGQNLFEPPNVKGWDGGTTWISTDTMMERFNFAATITGAKFDDMQHYATPTQLVYAQKLQNAGDVVDYFVQLLLDGDLPDNTRSRLVQYVSSDSAGKPLAQLPDDSALDTKMRGLVRLIMSLPTYQLA